MLAFYLGINKMILGFPGGSVVKNLPANVGDMGLIPRLGIFPGEGNSNPLHYCCWGNLMDRGAWRATVHWGYKTGIYHGVTEHDTT